MDLICRDVPKSTCTSTGAVGSKADAQYDLASPSAMLFTPCWESDEVDAKSAPRATSASAAPSPSIVTQKLPKRGIFSWPLAVIAKTVLPSLDSAFALHSSIASAPPPALQERMGEQRGASDEAVCAAEGARVSINKRDASIVSHARDLPILHRTGGMRWMPTPTEAARDAPGQAGARSLSSSITSRPSPAAIASKHGSKLTPAAPDTRHSSPSPDVIPLQRTAWCSRTDASRAKGAITLPDQHEWPRLGDQSSRVYAKVPPRLGPAHGNGNGFHTTWRIKHE